MKKALIIILFIFCYIFLDSYTTNKSLVTGIWLIQSGERAGEELVFNKNKTCFFSGDPDVVLKYTIYDQKHIGIFPQHNDENQGAFHDIGTFKRNRQGDQMSISWDEFSPKMSLKLIQRYN